MRKVQADRTCGHIGFPLLLWPATQASQGKIMSPNRYEPRISEIPGREEGTALNTELWTSSYGVQLFTSWFI